ncbi:hypothetical protein KY289_001065 [Solanum tuberosum]|nr:hypothetical protein KY289_001065 [Solanum tuberosum]
MDSGKALSIEAGSSRPSAVGPFESLAEELREFDDFLEDQRKQKAHLLRLEKAYTDLAKSHANDHLSSSRPDESNDVPTQWSEDDDVDDNEATESDDSE